MSDSVFPWNSVINGVFNLAGNAQQSYYNKELAQYQNAFNLEMWNKQNEYNSPVATMQRMVDAGINPRAYNNLGQFANSADAPQAAQYEKKFDLSGFSDIMLTMAQIENLKSQTAKNESEAKKNDADAANKTKQHEFYDYELNDLISRSRENRIKHEVYSRERGFSSWSDFDDILGKEFDNYIDDVIKIRKGQGQSFQELNDLRRIQKQLQQQELDNFDFIPREYRWIVETFLDFLKLRKK